MKLYTRYLFVALLCCFAAFTGNAQVTANFTASSTTGCPPLLVAFSNTSTGATSYRWDLDNGDPPFYTTSVSSTYVISGTFTATLTAFNGTDSSKHTVTITVYPNPIASFVASDTAVCPGTPITFTSTTISGVPGPVTCTWNFGDGSGLTGDPVNHSYGTPGYYSITLSAVNSEGCGSDTVMTNYIHIYNLPTPSFSAPVTYFCSAPGNADFTSFITGTSPYSYSWNFGDGSGLDHTADPTHTYAATGTYNVTLSVTDGHGCTDSVTVPAYIVVTHVVASFSYPDTGCMNATIDFANTSSTHTSSLWTFGDGNTSGADAGANIYTTSGLFTVTLVVGDGPCLDTIHHQIYIRPGDTGSIAQNPPEPCPPPVAVTFHGTAPATGSITWWFSDGGGGSGATVTHTFGHRGIDTIKEIITDSRTGCKDTITKVDTIYDLYPVVSALPTSGCAPLTVNFDAYAITYEPPLDTFIAKRYPFGVSDFSWVFGDGGTMSGPGDSEESYTYTTPGIYHGYVTLTTGNGCSVVDSFEIKVGAPPVVTFSATPTHVCYGHPITYNVTIISGSVTQFVWQFGDGGFDTTLSTSITYQDTLPGIFTVTVTPIDNGCAGLPVIMTDYITVDSPKAIGLDSIYCTPPGTAMFVDSSLGDDSHVWVFGDGTTSTLSDPVHTYSALALYDVRLATYNVRSGCRDTANLYISLMRPIPNFTTDTAICKYDTATFVASVTGGTASEYIWEIEGYVEDVGTPYKYGFETSGIFPVTLVIRDQNGCFDTTTKLNYMHVGKPVPSYTASPTSGCWPLTVTFTNTSTDIAGTTFSYFLWSFGDGGTDSAVTTSVTHTYTVSGSDIVTMIVTDNIGCKDTISGPNITVFRPTASFVASTVHPCSGTPVAFLNTSGTVTSSLWFFGDDSSSTLTNPTHTYAGPGIYNVTLIVTDGHGCTDTVTEHAYIDVTKPVASFYMSDSFSICPPLSVDFVNTSTGAVNYFWTLGDGTTSTIFSPSDFYIDVGYDTVKLIVANVWGCLDTAVGHISIYGYAGGFGYTPDSGCAPVRVLFTANTINVPNIVWDFSDGTTSTASYSDTISHVYSLPGAYVPRLILSDNTGCKASSIGIDTIKIDTVYAGFTTVPDPICQAGTVTFTDTSHGYWAEATTWLWTFYDGSTTILQDPTYTFTATGTYPVNLVVTDSWGCASTLSTNVMVYPPADITVSPDTTICTGDNATLTGHGGVNYTWTPTTSCSPCNPTYASPSVPTTYTVTGTDTHGCINTDTVTVFLKTKTITTASSDTQMCAGQVVPLWDSGATKYTWIPGTGLNDPSIWDPMATPPATTTYEIIAQLGSCVPDTNFVTVVVHPLPTVNAGQDQNVLAGSTAQLKATGTDIYKLAWSDPSTLSCDSCANPVASMSVTTTYFVSAYTQYSCSAEDSVSIRLYCDNSQIYIPNAFTPNGDGENDIFYPRGSGVSIIKSFRIYNRWGELLFERDDINMNDATNGWDGTFKGEAPHPDVYVWVLEATCETGQPLNLKGDVTIIR